VQALVLQPDGKILIGVNGERGLKDGVSRASQGVLRLNADGTRDAASRRRATLLILIWAMTALRLLDQVCK